jgi:membrane-associated protease RseP (regulator of RpoE activity)
MFNQIWKGCLIGSACLALLAAGSLAHAQSSRVEMRRIASKQDGQEGRGQAVRPSDHWLGLECFPVDALLRAHLNLAEGEGLVIEQVVPDSPAAKAELKQHDVIVKAGGTEIKSVADLMGAVDEAKENELALEIIRGGKPMTMKATPAKRPAAQEVLRRVPQRRMEEFRQLFDRLQSEQPGSLRYRMLGPGAVLPGKELPKDLSVSITRSGSEPAKITVKKGDQSWEVGEKELDKLPDDVRPHVERMLGRGVMAMPGMPPMPPDPRMVIPAPGRPEMRGPAEKQLKEMMDQLDKLRRQMEELQKALPKDSQPAPGESRA